MSSNTMSRYDQFNYDPLQDQYLDSIEFSDPPDNTLQTSHGYDPALSYATSQYPLSYAYGQGSMLSYGNLNAYENSSLQQAYGPSQYPASYAYGIDTQSSMENNGNTNRYASSYMQQSQPSTQYSASYSYGRPVQGNMQSYGNSSSANNPYLQQSPAHIAHGLNTSSASVMYGVAMQGGVPAQSNVNGFGISCTGHNYPQVAPASRISNCDTRNSNNAYDNINIPVSSTHHGHGIGQGGSRKRMTNRAEGEHALAFTPATRVPRSKRARPSDESEDSVQDIVGQGPPTKRRRAAIGDASGPVPDQEAAASGKNEPAESRKRESQETRKGTTSLIDGRLHWKNPETGEWGKVQAAALLMDDKLIITVPAVIHHDIRHFLIAKAQRLHPGQAYVHPDPTGGIPYNETSFKIEQQSWGPRRHQRPAWAFQWKPTVTMLRASPPKPGFMMYDGKVVLDPSDKPVKDHKNVPLTLSSEIPGCKMQFMKMQNPDLEQRDFWARMPRLIPKGGRRTGTKPLSKISTMVNMHMMRFREKQGCLSWSSREGSDEIEGSLLKLFAYYGFDPEMSNNSTIGFNRDLEGWESALVKLKNDGSAPTRSGKKALDPWTRYKEDVLKKQKIEAKDPALYLAVMGEPAPQLDLTKHTEYKMGDGENFEAKKGGRQTRKKVQRQALRRQISTEGSDEDEDSDSDRHCSNQSDTEDDENPIIIRGRSRNLRARKPVQSDRFQDQGDVVSLLTEEDNEDVDQDRDDTYFPGSRLGQHSHTDVAGSAAGQDAPRTGSSHDSLKRARDPLSEDDEAAHQPATKRVHMAKAGIVEEDEASEDEAENPDVSVGSVSKNPIKRALRPIKRHHHLPQPALGGQRPLNAMQPHLGDVLAEEVAGVSAAARNKVVDFIKVAPASEKERKNISRALDLTRDAYVELAGTSAPYTDQTDSYDTQWQRMNKSFAFDWAMWNMEFNQSPPHLFRLSTESWCQSLTDWNCVRDGLAPTEGDEVLPAPESMAIKIKGPDTMGTDKDDDLHQVSPNNEAKVDTEYESNTTESYEEKDWREVAPADDRECQAIENALKMTQNTFLKWTGMPGPRTDRGASYADQYRQILATMQIWWAADRPEEEEPFLARWKPGQFMRYMRAMIEDAREAEQEEEL